MQATKRRDAPKFRPADEAAAVARRDAARGRAAELSERSEGLLAGVSARVAFSYDAKRMGAGWDASRVKGLVASLVTIKDAAAATALETAAGGKLYQVVVDDAATGKALLERGNLRSRATIIPLDKITGSTVSAAKAAAAVRAAGGRGNVRTALSLVSCADPAVRPALEYVFGRHLIADDAESARAACFHPDVRLPVVTLEGDVFDPAGTVEGGSRAASGSVLTQMARLAEANAERDGALRRGGAPRRARSVTSPPSPSQMRSQRWRRPRRRSCACAPWARSTRRRRARWTSRRRPRSCCGSGSRPPRTVRSRRSTRRPRRRRRRRPRS